MKIHDHYNTYNVYDKQFEYLVGNARDAAKKDRQNSNMPFVWIDAQLDDGIVFVVEIDRVGKIQYGIEINGMIVNNTTSDNYAVQLIKTVIQ